MTAHLTQWQANLCATLGTHSICLSSFHSQLIISIMSADVYMHTNKQTNIHKHIHTHVHTHTHTHLFITKSCRSWHNFHFRQIIATQYFQIITYALYVKMCVFDYECSQIFGMSCYVCRDLLRYCRTIQTFFFFFLYSLLLSTWKCLWCIMYIFCLQTSFLYSE
jgi:hypothetical protein